MMKHNSTIIGLTAASFFALAASASASDLGIDSRADQYEPAPAAAVPEVSGVYVSGFIGYANIDRSATGSIEGSKSDELGTIFTDLLGPASASEDLEDTIYGGGLSYLHKFSGTDLGVEVGVDGTFYTDSNSEAEFGGFPVVTSVSAFGEGIYPDVGEEQNYGQLGSASFGRDYDVDLVLKGHYFLKPNFSVFLGAGPSWSVATASGEHASNYHTLNGAVSGATGVLDNSFKKQVSALGYVATAGFNWWFQDNVVFGVDGYFKQHDFDFGDSSNSAAEIGGNPYTFGVSDHLSVKDEIWGAKATLKIKLN